jgi:hypothetical protein
MPHERGGLIWARTIAIWVFGLLASAIFGGLVASSFLSSGDAGFWSSLAGCLRSPVLAYGSAMAAAEKREWGRRPGG